MDTTFSTFLSSDRRHALVTHVTLPEHVAGAVVFADISGFTALTEVLTRTLGPQRGAEELTRQLNQVYDALIAEVDLYGGAVIGFSGDSMTCWFDSGALWDADAAAMRALACARGMQMTMALIGAIALPGGSTSLLALKASVGGGSARRLVMGDPDIHLIDTLAGEALVRAVAGEGVAQCGEVILDIATARRLASRVRVSAWRSTGAIAEPVFAVISGLREVVAPQPWPQISTLDSATVKQWLLPDIFQRLQTGMGEFMTELRPAAAVFGRFGGIDFADDLDAGAKIDAYIRWVQQVLNRHHGTLIHVTLGEKGNFFYATFGVPIAHERDLANTLAAALVLREPPADFVWLDAMQIGITRGIVRAGAYGGKTRRTYGVLGDEVNLAARLMMSAKPNQILVTERIVAQAPPEYEFENIGALAIKGKRELVPTFALSGRRTVAVQTVQFGTGFRNEAVIIGREAECQLLREHIDALKVHGRGGIVCIEGEPGIGKSRLVAELRTQAHTRGITTFVGAGSADEHATLYYAWRDIFSQMLDLNVLTEPGQRRQHLFDLLEDEPDLLELAPLLNTIMLLELPDNAVTAPLIGQARAERTREMLLMFLRVSTARSPKVIVLEDAHWLDSASWALAVEVRRQLPRVLLVISSRPLSAPLPPLYHELLSDSTICRIQLAALTADDSVALVCQRLGVRVLPPPIAALIREKAQGNPFFSEELISTLCDAAHLTIANGECRLVGDAAALELLAFPDTVQGVISSRIDHLTPIQQLTLKVASVIGRNFDLTTLRAIYPLERETPQLEEHLSILEQLQHTRIDFAEPNLAYIFKHVITQEVAYNTMLFGQRRSLHRALAQWVELTHADDLVPYYPLLAHHWSRADGKQQALYYLDQAHDHALRDGADQEAHRFLAEAHKLLHAEN